MQSRTHDLARSGGIQQGQGGQGGQQAMWVMACGSRLDGGARGVQQQGSGGEAPEWVDQFRRTVLTKAAGGLQTKPWAGFPIWVAFNEGKGGVQAGCGCGSRRGGEDGWGGVGSPRCRPFVPKAYN